MVVEVRLELGCLHLHRTAFATSATFGVEHDLLRNHCLGLAIGGELGGRKLDIEWLAIKRATYIECQFLRVDGLCLAVELEVTGGQLCLKSRQIESRLAFFGRLTGRAGHFRLKRTEGVLLLFEVEQHTAGNGHLRIYRGLCALNPRLQVDLARHLVGNSAGRKIDLVDSERLSCGLVAVSQRPT